MSPSRLWRAAGSSVFVLLVGCNALLGTDAGERAAAPNESPTVPADGDGGATQEDKDADATLGDPPPDRSCGHVYWSDKTKEDAPGCELRRTTPIVDGLLVSGLSIERSLAGQVAIAYAVGTGTPVDGVPLSVGIVQFTDPKKISKRSIGMVNDSFGAVKLAKWKKDHFLLGYHTLNHGEISVVELGSAGPVGTEEIVATGLPSATYFSLATNAAGSAHLAWFDPDKRTLSARGKKSSTSAWSTRAEIDRDFVTDGPAGSGQVSLVLDEVGTPHVGYHRADYQVSSAPNYKTMVAGNWGGRRSVDIGGDRGFDIALGIFRESRFAAYYAPDENGRSRALRFASWTGTDGTAIEMLEEKIDVWDPLVPNTSVAMSVDAFGLVHLVTAFPVADATEIRYVRQTIVDGAKKWLSDIVDHQPTPKGTPSALVSIVMDEQSRPHIAYHVNGTLNYATIYDK